MIMKQLKEATSAEHRAVEALMPVLRPDLSRAEYTQLLLQLLRVVEPLERQLQALALPAAFTATQRQKVPLLRQDLAVLGLQGSPQPFPAVALDTAEALGALYVLEGATLGGQIISRHLQRTLNLTPDTGGAYFHGYGAATADMWRAFSQAMNTQVAPAQAEQVIAGARATFKRFGDALRMVAA